MKTADPLDFFDVLDSYEGSGANTEPPISRSAYQVRFSHKLSKKDKSNSPGDTGNPNAAAADLADILAHDLQVSVVFVSTTNATTKPDQQTVRIEEFLDTIQVLDEKGETRAAIDRLLDYVDDLLNNSEFAECDEVLRRVDVRCLSDAVLVSFLGITKAAQHKLNARASFYKAALLEVAKQRGLEAAKQLLAKYL